MKRTLLLTALLVGFGVTAIDAAPQMVLRETAATEAGLTYAPDNTDLINGILGTQISGGFHPANTAPADQIPAFTDGTGLSGLAGLINDFPGAATPAWSGFWTLGSASDIGEIRIFSGNGGKDGRIFHTVDVYYTTDATPTAGGTWTLIMEQARPADYGATNPSAPDDLEAALTVINDDVASGVLATAATGIRFDFYAVSNTARNYQDPYNGVNPLTSVDDGFTEAFESPLMTEVDVFATSSNSTVADWTMY